MIVRYLVGAYFAVALMLAAMSALASDPADSLLGLPQPALVPQCTAGISGFYGDSNGCVYSCAGGKTAIVTRPLGNTCSFATTGATATVTPTPTLTATPTPTVTA